MLLHNVVVSTLIFFYINSIFETCLNHKRLNFCITVSVPFLLYYVRRDILQLHFEMKIFVFILKSII